MSRILALVDDSAAARPVLATAIAMAPVMAADVDAVRVGTDAAWTARAAAESIGLTLRQVAGDPLESVVDLAKEDDVVAVVLAASGLRLEVPPADVAPAVTRPAGDLPLAVADAVDKPVLVVPPGAPAPDRIRRVLLGMEGRPGKGKELKRAVELASSAGLELTVVHVDDQTSIPSFSDQVQHETDAFAQEFLARHLPGAPTARLELRIGEPADEILAAAAAMTAEVIALGWPQSPERGAVAREILGRSHLPVLLVAIS
jgi:nucleotide-binding universal stress UspA family protein